MLVQMDSMATQVGRGEQAVTEGSGKSAMDPEVMSPENNIEIFLQMLRDMEESDHGGDGEQGEMDDRGKSAIEEDSNTTMVDPSSTNSTTFQDDHDSSEMDFEADSFALYSRSWEYNWSETCGSFEDISEQLS